MGRILGKKSSSKQGDKSEPIRKIESDRESEDTDYEDEEFRSDFELDDKKVKKQKGFVDGLMVTKSEMTLTTRQQARLSSKDATSSGASLIEFPSGLPPAQPRKQKEKLYEMEQQIKEVEVAQKRKMQNEKVAKEAEAKAIRKILRQDSSRKNREEKFKKRREELAQEKAANAHMLPMNTIRTVMAPLGQL
ncbi:hypothetical protein RIF29_16364 [Crotalaria pallida]|uniref:INO80 complex subunit B-like conserved region domain-containing protein n=1 Tax=Crotalaria pallida TaxID=3830 RepID=A0AAN9FGG9_CROPI